MQASGGADVERAARAARENVSPLLGTPIQESMSFNGRGTAARIPDAAPRIIQLSISSKCRGFAI